nr:superoxide dismutase family protein [uncultured Paracoccus sp.]
MVVELPDRAKCGTALAAADGPDFKSAGGHFAGGKEHGILNAAGPHPGDMPNFTVGADGMAKMLLFRRAHRQQYYRGDTVVLEALRSRHHVHFGMRHCLIVPIGNMSSP